VETCIAPVLSIKEALEFQYNLNKSVNLTEKLSKDDSLVTELEQIEKYLFPNSEERFIVDLNAKVFEAAGDKLVPKF
jgi:hypothetical protein